MPVSQVQLMGNITNVEMTVNNTGSAFIRGSLAVSQGKDANGEDKETLWFNLKAWGDLAENLAETYQNTVNAGGKSFNTPASVGLSIVLADWYCSELNVS